MSKPDGIIPQDVWNRACGCFSNHAGRMIVASQIVAERERCAGIADAYAEENMAMAQDTILMDPVLTSFAERRDRMPTREEIEKSDDLIVDGTIHSSMFHAAQNIAAAIRKGGE